MSDALDAMRWLTRIDLSVTRPHSHGVIRCVGEPPLEEVVEELREADPDGYAALSEHIELENYRDPRVVADTDTEGAENG